MRHVSNGVLVSYIDHGSHKSSDNTNAKHLELYSMLGEFDNAGFPLSYCLLSTATAIEIGKRTTALRRWTTYLRDKYGIIPRFVHVDKDMAKISMSKSVWPTANIQLCWWHLRKAIRERLAKSKLSTTPYKPARANHKFPFIDISFAPAGTADAGEFEGGVLLEPDEIHPEDEAVPSLSICIPNLSQLRSSRDSEPNDVDSVDDEINTNRNPLTIKIKIPKKGLEEQSADIHSRVFCPTHLRETVIALIEHHFCAHPLIPGYSHPSAVGIRQWAVKQMYTICKENNLCEVWAYLWENWYRCGRWELWARAVAPMEVPRLKTTMIMESQ